jgi:uncharacterized membrane protein YccC
MGPKGKGAAAVKKTVTLAALIGYFAVHLWMAAALYGTAGMGTFFLLLFVPGAGDVLGVILLLRAGARAIPLALAAAAALLVWREILEKNSLGAGKKRAV